jgi:hypothetical protein
MQKDAGTFIVHPVARPTELYQVSNRPESDSLWDGRAARQIFSKTTYGGRDN